MDIGILPEFRNPTQWAVPIEQVYREGIEKAVLAERLGFDHFWTSEHHFAIDSWSPSLLTILAAAPPARRASDSAPSSSSCPSINRGEWRKMRPRSI